MSLNSGVIMMSGHVKRAEASNFFGSPTNPLIDDPDLMAISGINMWDAAILEFDFKPLFNSFSFNFVFASTEYPSYTCSGFNDAFGFFLSGPGISGSFTNNAINIALIPGRDTPVAKNTINSGTPSGNYSPSVCLNANPSWIEDSQYFVDNSEMPATDIQFPGMTQTFAASAQDLQAGEWYHIKIAIGDAMDGALDSGVFHESYSLKSLRPVSVGEVEKHEFTIYPNPAKSIVTLSFSNYLNTAEMEVYNANGSRILFEKISGDQKTIAITDFPAGIYFVKITSPTKVMVNKLIVNK